MPYTIAAGRSLRRRAQFTGGGAKTPGRPHMRDITSSTLLLAALTALTAVSCGKRNLKRGGAGTGMSTSIAADPALAIREGRAAEPDGNVRGGGFVPAEGVRPVYFNFDGYGMPEAARETLRANAALLKAHRDWVALVEGHCDSRGTVAYNLALGQKRAKAVRDYYVRLGVPETSVGTISYGEEKPSCEEETETCWEKNRRADTKVKMKERPGEPAGPAEQPSFPWKGRF